jgi:hypothetical protein
VEVSERVEATPAAVWDVVTDIGLPARFYAELQSVSWVGAGDRVAVGNRFLGHNRHPALGEWTTESVVVEVEEQRRWVWEVLIGTGVAATWAFEVDPGSSAVTVRQWARMGPAPSGLSLAIEAMPDKEARIVANRLAEWEAGMRANLAGIKQLLSGT